MIMNNAWCPLPWIGLNIRNNGDVRVCCNANIGENQGLIRKENNTCYNLSTDSFQDSRNGALMNEIRLSMLHGEFHPSCIRCQQEFESGMQARFHWEREIWNSTITLDEAKSVTNQDGTIDVNTVLLKYIDVRFGNKCNLKCRMCGPTDSDQWYDDTVTLWGEHYIDSGQKIQLIRNNNGKYSPKNATYDWWKNPQFWNDLEEIMPSIARLYIVGGEPLLIDQHYNFLQKCIDAGYAKNILIEYNTNITVLPDKIWKLWKEFNRIQIGISLDAIGPLNDYIRYPSKWENIRTNLYKLDNAEGNFKIWWAATISIYNILHLPDMMMWKIEQNFKRINKHVTDKPIISPHPLHNPKFLNIKMFSHKSKKIITEYFSIAKQTANYKIKKLSFLTSEEQLHQYTWFCNILDQYEKYMWSEDYSDDLEKFLKYNNTLDNIRKESLKSIAPEVWRLLTNEQ